MSGARAIWKGVIEFGKVSVPVKLYSAVENQSVSFRLLHRSSGHPVSQVLVNPKTNEIVEHEASERGFVTDEGQLVSLDAEELEALEPEASRTINVTRFVRPGTIEYRWYQRPYYLGPDGDDAAYYALVAALGLEELEGVANWVMRGKECVGSLRLHAGYPMLITLRYASEIVPLDDFSPGTEQDLEPKQLAMARQLIDMLAADFEPATYVDEYRESVLELIEKKRRGDAVKKPTRRRQQAATSDLTAALEKSLGGRPKGGSRKGKAAPNASDARG